MENIVPGRSFLNVVPNMKRMDLVRTSSQIGVLLRLRVNLDLGLQTEVEDTFVKILEGKVDIKDGAKNKWDWITQFADVGSCCQKV